MQLFLHVQRLVGVNREVVPGKRNFSVKCKPFGGGGTEKVESDVVWGRDNPAFDLRVVCPMSIESVMRMEQAPWIIELYNTEIRANLAGILKLSLA
jgi:hypothetical protein